MAKTFARGLANSRTSKLIAVGSRSRESADEFGSEFNISKCYDSYESLLADKDVRAVYISTPHSFHAEWAIKSAEAGKHILCEKPLGINHAEAMAIVEAAYENNVFLMEAFMYRCHPQTARLVEILKKTTIGDIRVIKATFSFRAKFDPNSRLFNNALGGGSILDVGCYAISMSRLIAGIANGKDFEEPLEIKGSGYIGKSNVDEYASVLLKFPNEIIAEVTTGISVSQENIVQIFGTEGNVTVPNPWTPSPEGGTTKITINKYGEPTKEIIITCKDFLYAIEADVVAKCIEAKQASSPTMSWDDSLGNMKVLDEWRASI